MATDIMDHSIRQHQGISPIIATGVYIDPAATVIGNVSLGKDSSVWPGAVIRGDMHHIIIGARTSIQDNVVLHITHASEFNPRGWPLTIGDDVIVGHGAILHGCTIEDRVLVGNGAIINDGAIIKSDVIIGAGCMVPPGKEIASGHVYVGNPCKALRPVTEKERKFFSYSPANYVKLKDQYLNQRSTKD